MKLLRTLTAAAVLGAAATSSMATAVTVDAGWYGFCFGATGSGATAGCKNEGIDVAGNTMTFTLASAGTVKVTDGFNIGDTFNVLIDGLFAFHTSVPGSGATLTDPDALFASGYYSAGSIVLAAGSHTLDIVVDASPFGGGGAYVEVVTGGSVPLPGTLALVGAGMAALGLRRRKQA
ncbi:MAG: PEP-CTERM sorting domain-containing protein [Burkholderiales bacterium]|nr:PEP-CTERM sorting domain-containing protein [Burkholderiales bacterium]